VNADFDRRLTPARGDLAAAHLKGKIPATAYVEGRTLQVSCGVLGLYSNPVENTGQQTQLLFGETFKNYEEKNGWLWGQADLDGYVGYARADGFALPEPATHRVSALATPLFFAPDVKQGTREILPMNAKLSVTEPGGRFARLTNGLYVFSGHLTRIDSAASDWVEVAERFNGVPYVWGGKTSTGIDCSGLVQTALEAGGIKAPRDTDMMEAALGIWIAPDASLRRGDLVFWNGHVGIMLDGERLIHANGFTMQVSVEPLKLVDARTLAREGLPIRSIRRLGD
jgi:NlpC/P60 family protein/dipeptidyl peptidase-like protein